MIRAKFLKSKRVDFEFVRFLCPMCGERYVEAVRIGAATTRSMCHDVRIPLLTAYDVTSMVDGVRTVTSYRAEHADDPRKFKDEV